MYAGALSIANALDYEASTWYRVQVIARDSGCPSLDATSTVTIEVLNVNDHEPRFDQNHYEVFLSEDAVPGSFVIQLVAVDDDIANSK